MSKAPQPSKSKTLPIKVRVVIGLMSLPSLLLTAFLIKTALDGNWDTVDAFEVIYNIFSYISNICEFKDFKLVI